MLVAACSAIDGGTSEPSLAGVPTPGATLADAPARGTAAPVASVLAAHARGPASPDASSAGTPAHDTTAPLSAPPLEAASLIAPPSAPLPMTMPPRPVLDDEGILFVSGDDTLRPRIRYRDGQVSQNDSCAIRLDNRLNRKIPPVYVNGQPIGFC